MAKSSRLCLICGQVFTSDAERRSHIESDHPGQHVEWRDRVPFIVEGTTETRIGPSALKRMRRNARSVTGGHAAVRGRAVVRSPAAVTTPEPVAPMVETPLPDDPDAPPYFTQVQPPHITALGETIPPAETQPTTASADDATAAAVAASAAISRDAIKLVLDQQTLAGMIRNLSVVISDWDGAGPAGHLSAIEAGQLAMLVQDPAVTVVQRYFGGNVDRFKLALALGILILGKGRVHARAIAAKRAKPVGPDALPESDPAYLATQPDTPTEVPAPSGAPDPIADLAARQRAWNTTPHEALP